MLLTALQKQLLDDKAYDSVHLSFPTTLSDGLQDLFLDILSIDHYFRLQVNSASKLRPELFQAILIKICYKLIENWSMLAHKRTNSIEDLLQLTLISFMITFWYPWGEKSEMFPFLYKRFRKVIETTPTDCIGSERLLLWAVLIGKCSMFSAESDSWLISVFTRLAMTMELWTWEDVLHMIDGLPWIKFIHQKHGRDLFNKSKAEGMSGSISRISD